MPPSGEATIAIEWSLLALSFFFVSLRIYSYFLRGRTRPISELLLIFSLVVETGCIICDTITYHLGGLTRYASEVPNTIPLNKLWFASDVLFYLGVFLPKACIVAFYYDLVPTTSTRVRIALKCLTAYLAGSMMTIFLGMFVSCRPLSTNWSTDSDYCPLVTGETFFRIHASFDLSCDLMIFILPFFLIHDLKLHKRQKYTVYGIFLLAGITIAISIARCIAISISPENTPIYIWAAAEYCGSMIVVCLPSLKPLLKSLGISISSSLDRTRTRRTWVYDKYGSNKGGPVQDGVATFVHAASPDGSQVELRKLEGGILKTSSVTVE
ncbi:hypothetical protein BKA65DRAFT_3 [Rhexocercosporidium sp. MPI-PUGE-AT-0058]|nr:hypothetical protein BKA65DRAFT_3 [Rhexocercosporidium sp. MPI-PUGE-AT-0058]